MLEELEELRERILAYEAPKTLTSNENSPGFLQLGKKTADGVVRITKKSQATESNVVPMRASATNNYQEVTEAYAQEGEE